MPTPVWKGLPASGGIGIGRAVLLREESPVAERRFPRDARAERIRLEQALDAFDAELEQAAAVVDARLGSAEAGILRAQSVLLRDPGLLGEALRIMEEQGLNAEYAFDQVCSGLVQLFSQLDDETMRARAADFQDIRDRVLRILTGAGSHWDVPPMDSVLVAEDIPPSHSSLLDPGRVRGIVLRAGTPFSHISILARALGLPAVVAVSGLEHLEEGQTLVVDGDAGEVLAASGEEQLQPYRRRQCTSHALRRELEEFRHRPTVTRDGCSVRVAANYAVEQELPQVLESGAESVGLFRTEYLFMDRRTPPGEGEQEAAYSRILRAMGNKPVIVRTLDVGGDKDAPCLSLDREANPYLGLRGIRFSLDREELFRVQLSALLRAGAGGKLWIMLPMVTSVEELRRARSLLAEEAAKLDGAGVERAPRPLVGAMVETPAAALCADLLAREADFLSIGTNDLTQYTLAVDRGNPKVSGLYDAAHPAVLRLIRRTADAARAAGIPVSVCGEAAANPALIPFFVGTGVDELSVGAGDVLRVRKQICGLSREECRDLAEGMLRG